MALRVTRQAGGDTAVSEQIRQRLLTAIMGALWDFHGQPGKPEQFEGEAHAALSAVEHVLNRPPQRTNENLRSLIREG
jgi:hypothetical protein